QGSRSGFGALHVGIYEGDTLVYVTKVGTGFDSVGIASIGMTMEPLARDTSPFEKRSPGPRGNHWVEPKLVCEVRFTEWTDDGGLRPPTFMGLRPDVKPRDCRREEPVRLEEAVEEAEEAPSEDAAQSEAPKRSRKKAGGARARSADAGADKAPAPTDRALAPSRPAPTETGRGPNPRKVFWPDDGYTKGDLVGFYEAIALNLLPFLRDRPVVLTRYPDGIAGKSFFQKDAPVYVPDWVRTEVIAHEDVGRDIRYFVIEDLESLRYV